MFQSNYYTAGKEAVRDLRKYNSLGQGHKLQCGIFSWSFIFWLFIYFFSPRRKPFQHPRVTFTRVFLTRRTRTHTMSPDQNLTNFFSQKRREKNPIGDFRRHIPRSAIFQFPSLFRRNHKHRAFHYVHVLHGQGSFERVV